METKNKSISVVGFYSHDGSKLFIYNSYDDRFDDWSKLDLSDVSFKYDKATIKQATICMQMEGCVGKLEIINLEY